MNWRSRPALVGLSIAVAMLTMGLWLHSFKVTPHELAELAARLRWWPVLPLFLLLAGHVALSAWRWSLIEVGLGGERPRFGAAFAAGAIALGLGTFLPAPLINVACRGFANRISGTSGLRGAFSGGIDQLADLAVVGLIAIPAIIAFLRRDLALFAAGAVAMAVLGLLLTLTAPALIRWALTRFAGTERVATLTSRPLLLKIYGISLLRVGNLIVMTLAVHAASGAATATAVIIGVPLVTLAISAAMLPGGFGVSEWSFSAVFAHFGVTKGEIVLFVLANRIILTGLSLTVALVVVLAMAPALIRRAKPA